MGRPRKDDDKLALSSIQLAFVDAYFLQDKSPTKIAKVLGWPDRGRVSSMLKSEKVQIEIARRKGQMHLFNAGNNTFNLSISDRVRLLWSIAQAGTGNKYDANGNEVMISPQASVNALREINLMMGDNAPTEVEVSVSTVDVRTESEVHENIQQLVHEFKNLPESDGVHPSF